MLELRILGISCFPKGNVTTISRVGRNIRRAWEGYLIPRPPPIPSFYLSCLGLPRTCSDLWSSSYYFSAGGTRGSLKHCVPLALGLCLGRTALAHLYLGPSCRKGILATKVCARCSQVLGDTWPNSPALRLETCVG